MRQILKFDIPHQPHSKLSLPADFQVLRVGTQARQVDMGDPQAVINSVKRGVGGTEFQIVLWGIGDLAEPKMQADVYSLWTGKEVPDEVNESSYIGTVQLPGQGTEAVFHIFYEEALLDADLDDGSWSCIADDGDEDEDLDEFTDDFSMDEYEEDESMALPVNKSPQKVPFDVEPPY